MNLRHPFIAPAILASRSACQARLLLLVLAIAATLSSVARAATYYVAPTGDDTRTASAAQNISTPWQTIQKAASSMVAGDICYIRAGTYRETVTPANSGNSSAPITFQAYGTEIVTIDGTTPITGWVSAGGNIWNAPMSWTLGDGNQVFLSGAMLPEARWPNAGPDFPWQNSSLAHPTNNELGDWTYANAAGYTGTANGWITDPQLPSRPDGYWDGAIMNIMSGFGWVMASPSVTAYASSSSTLTTNDSHGPSGGAYSFAAGNEYYLTGLKGEMDSAGEWFYDPAVSTLSLYSTSSPTGVTAKQRSYGFNLSSRSYIQLVNLDFFGCTVESDGHSANNTYSGLSMKFLGHSRKVGASIFGLALRNGDVLRNSELAWDSRSLVQLLGSNIRVINNDLHDSGYMANWEAVIGNATGSQNLISHNTIAHAGRGGIGNCGRAAIVEYNNVNDAMKLTTDGAIFDSNVEAGNTVIRYNLFHDSPGPQGHLGNTVQGFYLDAENSNWIVHHNIVWNVPGYAFQLNCRHNFDKFFNNTCWGTPRGSLLTSFAMSEESGTHIFNNLFDGPVDSATWDLLDARFNYYNDPSFVSPSTGNFELQSGSPAIDQGTVIPGVTDGYVGSAPDYGALEYGGTNWTTSAGFSTTPPSPDPTYGIPAMIFANQVVNGSFESGGLTPGWTATGGSNITILSSNAWNDVRLRSGLYGLQFGAGTSEIHQTVTGLLPGHRYKVYGGVRRTGTSTVTLGVRNYGYAALQTTANVMNRTTPLAAGEGICSDPTWWTMYNQSFVTGPTSTSADIYLDVIIPSGVTTPVYADDFGLELMEEPDPQPAAMPLLQYPLNETSGTIAHDGTTNGRNGTVYGGAVWGTGVSGGALNLNGTDAYLLSPAMATPTSEITVACWARSNTSTWNDNGFLISKRPSFVLHPNQGSTDVRFFVYIGGVAQTVYFHPPSGFDITQWHHYCGTYSSTLQRLCIYVDGVLQGSSNVSGAIDPDSGQIFIGKDDYTGRFFNGSLDDVRIYNVALTAQEVAVDFNLDPSLMMRLKFDETAPATQAWDASANGLNGTLNNMNPSTAWIPGVVNGAITFNGVNNYVTTAAVASPVSEMTVACWARSNTSTWNDYGFLVSKRPSFVLHPDQGTTNVRFFVNIGGVPKTVYFYGPAGFDITQWHHYAGTYSSSLGVICIYVDGALKASMSVTGNIDPDSGQIFIGKDDYPGRYFNGSLDDVRIYTRALSWDQILDLSVLTDGPPY